MNLPNTLSLIRLFLVPVFAAVYFSSLPDAHAWAVLVYAAASVTDIADGYIARRFHQITRLGRVLDPLADKLMTFTVILCIALDGTIPLWAVAVFLGKEILMAVGGACMLHRTKDVISSNWLGKASTAIFFVVLAVLVLFPVPRKTATLLISFALLFTIAALFRYIVAFRQVMREHPKEK